MQEVWNLKFARDNDNLHGTPLRTKEDAQFVFHDADLEISPSNPLTRSDKSSFFSTIFHSSHFSTAFLKTNDCVQLPRDTTWRRRWRVTWRQSFWSVSLAWRSKVRGDAGTFSVVGSHWLQDFVKAQNSLFEEYIARFPYLETYREQYASLLRTFRWRCSLTKSCDYERYGLPFRGGDRWYYGYNEGLSNQSIYYTVKDVDSKEKGEIFFDPNKLSEDGTIAAWFFSGQSNELDRRWCLVSRWVFWQLDLW